MIREIVLIGEELCDGLIGMIQTALSQAGRNVPVKVVVISTQGQVLSEEWIPMAQMV